MLDIACHHTGNLKMFDNTEWNGNLAWENAEDEPWLHEDTSFTARYAMRADKSHFCPSQQCRPCSVKIPA